MKIKGLKIEIGADSQPFLKELDKLNGSLRFTDSMLKDVNRLLKLDPKNTELLTQKKQLLTKQIEGTNEKLKNLKQLSEELAKTPGQEKQWNAVKREIIETENQLKNYKNVQKEVIYEMSNFSKVAGNLKNIGDGFGTISQKTKGLSVAASGALVGLGALAIKSSQTADEILTLSKQTNLTAETIQRMKYSAELLDVPFETVQKSLARTTANMNKYYEGNEKIIDIFDDLGVELDDVNGKTKTSEEIFYNLIDSMKQIEDVTTRERVAVDLFGKSYQELMPLIDSGSNSFKELSASAQNILPQEELEKISHFDDEMQKLKKDAEGVLAKIGGEIAIGLKPVLSEIIKIVRNVSNAFNSLDPNIKVAIVGFIGLLAVISPLAGGLSLLFSGLSGIIGIVGNVIASLTATTTATTGLGTAAAGAGTSIGAMLLPIAAVVAAVVAFIAIFIDTYNKMEEFRVNVGIVIDSIVLIFQGLMDFITGVFTGDWDKAFNGLANIFKGVFEALPALVKMPFQMIQNFLGGFLGWFDKLFGTDLKGVLDSYLKSIYIVIDSIKGVFDGLIQFFTGIFTGNWEKAWNGVVKIFGNIWNGIVAIVKAPFNAVISIINSMTGAINNALASINIKIPDWVPFVGGKGFKIDFRIPAIPHLSVGTNEVYRDGLAMIHKGEAVVPAEVAKGGFKGGNQELTINIPLHIDKKQVGKAVATIVSDVQGMRLKQLKGV